MFEEKPTDAMLKKLLIGFIVLLLVIYPTMLYFFTQSRYPTDIFMMGQLSFSGDVMKDFYFRTADLDAYRLGQYLDYGFMVSYGGLLFTFALWAGRKFPKGTKLRSAGENLACAGIVAAMCDAFENGFILLTLENPFGFPEWYAVIHSVLALIKWILIIMVFFWILFAPLLRRTQKK